MDTVTTVDINDEYDTDTDDNTTINEWNHRLLDEMDIDLDALISSTGATTASKHAGVTTKNLNKVRSIDAKTSGKTLDVTTQLLRQSDDPNYLGTA